MGVGVGDAGKNKIGKDQRIADEYMLGGMAPGVGSAPII